MKVKRFLEFTCLTSVKSCAVFWVFHFISLSVFCVVGVRHCWWLVTILLPWMPWYVSRLARHKCDNTELLEFSYGNTLLKKQSLKGNLLYCILILHIFFYFTMVRNKKKKQKYFIFILF